MQDLLSSWQIRILTWRARAKGRPPLSLGKVSLAEFGHRATGGVWSGQWRWR